MQVITGSPVRPFVDALLAKLRADTALLALVTGVYGHLSETQATAYPYITFQQPTADGDAGAMQLAGDNVSVQLDVFSRYSGQYEAGRILSRMYAVLERQPVRVSGFDLIGGSLHREHEHIQWEPDEDDPKQGIYHGVQRWTAEIHEVS